MEYSNVRSPQWANKEKTVVNVLLTFEGLGEIPFSASELDDTEHGKEIYRDVKLGKYGGIVAYCPPSDEFVAAQVRTERDRLLRKVYDPMAVQLARDLRRATDEEEKAALSELLLAWDNYATVLQGIPEAEGFPYNVTWPVAPI